MMSLHRLGLDALSNPSTKAIELATLVPPMNPFLKDSLLRDLINEAY